MEKYYTLDRKEDGYHIFLLQDNEEIELGIKDEEVKGEYTSGDIVKIVETTEGYGITKDKRKTKDMRDRVERMLEKLKNKK